MIFILQIRLTESFWRVVAENISLALWRCWILRRLNFVSLFFDALYSWVGPKRNQLAAAWIWDFWASIHQMSSIAWTVSIKIHELGIWYWNATGVSKPSETNFWTSGFKDKDCNSWCTNKGTNESISPLINWLQKTPTNPLVDKCVTVDFNFDASKSGLKFADCANTNQFICEVKPLIEQMFFQYELIMILRL